MALRSPPWRRRPISLTPLIDIIFLLLLFFMLSSTFTRFAELPLMNSASAPGAQSADTAPLFLRLGADSLSLNGENLPLEALLPALTALQEGDTQILLVTLQDPAVTAQRLVDLLALLRQAPWLSVSVLN